MLRPTFLGYKTAASALKVNQNLLDIVGQNISNINTKGYTRQRLDINSVSLSPSNSKFGYKDAVTGQGVEVTGVSQFRDAFLDLRYRMEAARAGGEEVQLEALSDLETVFDEISKDGLDAQFSNLIEQLHSLTSSPSDPVLEGVVRTSAQMLTQMFNDYAEQIDTIKNQQLNYLENGAIVKINQLSENIAKLNQQIKRDNVSGNPALELNDERNMLIDELSNYLDIEVDQVPLNIGGGKVINELVIKLRNVSDPEVHIVNREHSFQLKVDSEDDKTLIKMSIPELNDDGTVKLNNEGKAIASEESINSNLKLGQLSGYLKFLNGKGEFAANRANPDSTETDIHESAKGVNYYNEMLNTLANKFATVMNEANKTVKIDEQGSPVLDDDGNYQYEDKDLFSARSGDVITAKNIKISDDWANTPGSYITNTKKVTTGDNSGATDNILNMISLFQSGNGTFKFTTTGSESAGNQLFSGTFQEFLSYTTTRLNLQVDNVLTSYESYSESKFQIDFARDSMSSVDLNEEGINLLQYSKSYSAAARLMTTLDEMLDTLINMV